MPFLNAPAKPALKIASLRAWPWFLLLCALPCVGLLQLSPVARTACLGLYGVSSVLSMTLYWLDKRFAHTCRQRISERTLHWVDAFGGWPGGWWAQRVFRHKTSKRAFICRYGVGVFAHNLLWTIYVAFISPLHDALFNMLNVSA